MSERIWVRKWLFYWVAWSNKDVNQTFRARSREKAISKAALCKAKSDPWEIVDAP